MNEQKTIENYFSALTDDEINQAFEEYEVWRKGGVLYEGILRDTYNKFCEENNTKLLIFLIGEPLLYEIIQRYRNR